MLKRRLRPWVPRLLTSAPQQEHIWGWHNGTPRRRLTANLTTSSSIQRPTEDIAVGSTLSSLVALVPNQSLPKHQPKQVLRAAQRESRYVEEQTRLGLEYHQIVRKYHTALRKRNKSASRVDISRVRKECTRSFWKFVSKVLDSDQTSSNSEPSFDSSSAQKFFTRVYSSYSKSFDTPSWLPVPFDPHTRFNSDDIQLEELQYAIRISKHSSSPSRFDQIPYFIIKRCPVLLPALLDIHNHCWHTYDVPLAWKRARPLLLLFQRAGPKRILPILLILGLLHSPHA